MEIILIIEQVEKIGKKGFATKTHYSKKLTKLIDVINLTTFNPLIYLCQQAQKRAFSPANIFIAVQNNNADIIDIFYRFWQLNFWCIQKLIII